MKNLTESKSYQFFELEEYLRKRFAGIMLRLYDARNNQNCLMWCFHENFSSAYQSGDCVLFYDDAETYSANPDDEFIFKSVIKI